MTYGNRPPNRVIVAAAIAVVVAPKARPSRRARPSGTTAISDTAAIASGIRVHGVFECASWNHSR